ncbi:protein CUP-SHAPED COTYLEDON 1 [Sesamum alatum]|uniref:Protein CUP-SHAPED COTYLEDON 1 n=1 Tax=Sesamum alatum TaxID=300844 RepID=A0AAE1YUL7_9LAMI|nr:protein CUP-SHAPED COTYLEDON 1 [Sesamum alatum]
MMETIIIPPGFHFAPTDQELLSFYLLRKAMGLHLPWNPVLEKTLYGENADPWDVFADVQWDTSVNECKNVKSVIYVFTKLSKVNGKTRIARTAGCGKWDGQTGAKNICNNSGELIGHMKMFTFTVKNTPRHGTNQRHHWIMHEYSLAGVSLNYDLLYKDYVICRITRSSKGKSPQQPTMLTSVLGECSNSCGEINESSNDNGLGKKRSGEQLQEVECQKKQKNEPEGRSTYVGHSGYDNFGWTSDSGYANAVPLQQLPAPVEGCMMPQHDQTDEPLFDLSFSQVPDVNYIASTSENVGGAPLQQPHMPVDGCLMPQHDQTDEPLFDLSFSQVPDYNYMASTSADVGGAPLQQPPMPVDGCNLMPQHDHTNGQERPHQEDEPSLDVLIEYENGNRWILA